MGKIFMRPMMSLKAIIDKLTSLGVSTPSTASVSDIASKIGTLATNKYNDGNAAGKSAVTVSSTSAVSGRTVTATAKASNGKTATSSASVAYAGTNGTVSVSTGGGSGKQTFDIPDGWATQVVVDRTGAYNAGELGRYNNLGATDFKYHNNANYGTDNSFSVVGGAMYIVAISNRSNINSVVGGNVIAQKCSPPADWMALTIIALVKATSNSMTIKTSGEGSGSTCCIMRLT